MTMRVIRDFTGYQPSPYPVATIGNFDGQHRGHQTLLRTVVERARTSGGQAVVITFDPHPVRILAPQVTLKFLTSPEEKLATMRRYNNDLRAAAGNPHRGKDVYAKSCGICHQLGGEGNKIGPDLTTANRQDLAALLGNIVDPNAVVGADYQLNVVTKKDGAVISGIIERESDTMLVVRTATDSINVPKAEIKDRQILEQSMMPAGLLEGVTQREALDLLRFLLIGRR